MHQYITLELLYRLRKVHEKHLDKEPKPTLHQQICHIHSEASEIYEALKKWEPCARRHEEACDVIYTTITYLFIEGLTDEQIQEALYNTLRKIERRANL